MSFRDNLQHLRATHAMTQEQLALMLGVSRQSVTKWEAEKSYPEMDKLLKLCQIFDVTLDDLVQGDLTTSVPTAAVQARAAVLREAAGGPPQDVCGYDEHMRAFAWKIAWGVFAILIGVALLMAVAGWAEATAPSLAGASLIPLFAGIAVGLGLIVTAAFQHTEFQRSHPFIQDFYTVEDRQRTQRLFAWLLVAGIALVFTGIVLTALTDSLSEFVQTEAAALMMGLIAVGVWCIVYGSMMLGRLNIANYNDAREQAIAESDEGKVIVNSDAAALRAMYTCLLYTSGDNQGVFAHCVADLGDHFRKELGLHSEHQHIGRFGNFAVAGGDGDAELLGALLPRGLGLGRADDVGGGDHSRVAVFAVERCVLAQQASDNGRGHVS